MSRPARPYAAREAAYWFGLIAEWRVMLFLSLRGYRILGHRLRTPVGEIDLLATRGDTLAIVEVKARRRHGDAAHALSPRQQERLKRAALFLSAQYPQHASGVIRFDCCTVSWYMRVHHMVNILT